ncbi:hypothetical protein CfE428DRAFT_6081 [Chthoniobacter flavus Ellin428]|uniref:Uncharacterized protein n=1 Tax=Chthoniobacter flavus Ellin428 TaxID=497964 RepID=B4DAZ0_9BACT|nr:hypothetical protein CfE428DRAFT_6081 [Chthoniobacter flavus Ellin428]TCO92452.1 hypothetical protein EV701_106221 [Chthoniobacter flavus]
MGVSPSLGSGLPPLRHGCLGLETVKESGSEIIWPANHPDNANEKHSIRVIRVIRGPFFTVS